MGKGEEIENDDSEVEGLKPEEAIEFLKLVEQARVESEEPPGSLDSPEDIPKPKKRFGLKSKGKKESEDLARNSDADDLNGKSRSKTKAESSEPALEPFKSDESEAIQESPLETTDTRKTWQPTKISDEQLKAILEGRDAEPKSKESVPPAAERKPLPASAKRTLRLGVAISAVVLITGALVIKFWPVAPTRLPKETPPSPAPLATPPQPPPATVPVTAGQPPDLIAVYFLRALSLKRYPDAYALMSREKQSELSVNALSEAVTKFHEAAPETLTKVRIDSTSIDGSRAEILLKLGASDTVWKATLNKRGDRWVVHSLEGDLNL